MYSNYFGFTTQPFTSLDNQVFLDSSAYRAACSCLRQGLAERRGLLLFTGAAGTGKTTLLRRLMTEVKDRAHCILFWNAHLGFDDLLNYLCDSLGLPVKDTGQMQKIQALEVYLIGQMAEGWSVVLMMDDAQNLPDETLEGLHQLARLETAGRRLLQIILSGQPPLEARLTQTSALESLNRNLGGHCRLEPLDDATAIAYIHEHLRAAGHPHGADLFEPAALDRVVSYSQGIPRSINLICNQALLLTYLNSESRVCTSMVRKVGTDHPMPASSNRTAASPKPESEGPVTVSIPVTPIIQHPQSVSPTPAEEPITSPGEFEFAIPARSAGLPPRSRSTRRRRTGFLMGLMVVVVALGTLLINHQINIPLHIPSDWNRLLSSLDRFSWSGDPPEASLDRLSVVQIEEPADTLEDPDPLPADGSVSDAAGKPLTINSPTEEIPDPATEIPIIDKETFPFQAIPEEPTTPQPESAQTPPPSEEASKRKIEPSIPDKETPAVQAVPKQSLISQPESVQAPPDPASAERIEALLSQAKQQLAALQYTIPAGANALDTYHEVLELDPANTAALQGIEYLKSRFVQWAAAARARGELAKAQRQLEKALAIDPHDDDIRQRLEKLRGQ